MPISEYATKQEYSEGTPVMVKIHSTQRDMIGSSLFGKAVLRGDDIESILEDAEYEKSAGNYILTTQGSADFSDKTTISYIEDGLSEVGECTTEISFSAGEPKSVTITRSGAQMCIFLIEEGKRQFSIYTTPYGPLEMCIYAKRVDNRITPDGGTLILDYAVELKGMTAQRTKMRVDIKPLKSSKGTEN